MTVNIQVIFNQNKKFWWSGLALSLLLAAALIFGLTLPAQAWGTQTRAGVAGDPGCNNALFRVSMTTNPVTGAAYLLGAGGGSFCGYSGDAEVFVKSSSINTSQDLSEFGHASGNGGGPGYSSANEVIYQNIATGSDGTAYMTVRSWPGQVIRSSWLRKINPDGSLVGGFDIGTSFNNTYGISPDYGASAVKPTNSSVVYFTGMGTNGPNPWVFGEATTNGAFNGTQWNNMFVNGAVRDPNSPPVTPAICAVQDHNGNEVVAVAGNWNNNMAAQTRVNGVWGPLSTTGNSGTDGFFYKYQAAVACGEDGYAYTTFRSNSSVAIGVYTPGVGWSTPNKDIFANSTFTADNAVTTTPDGRVWVAGSGGGGVYVIYSSDHGLTWSSRQLAISNPDNTPKGLGIAYSKINRTLHVVGTYTSPGVYHSYYNSQQVNMKPFAPTVTAATPLNSSQIQVSFNTNNPSSINVDQYLVQHRPSGGGAFTTFNTITPNGSTTYSVTDSGLGYGQSYDYQVVALNSEFQATSNILSATPLLACSLNWDSNMSRTPAKATLTTAPVISVHDPLGALVTNYPGNITLSDASGGGNLQGPSLTLPTTNGIATFNGLHVDKIFKDFQIKALGTGISGGGCSNQKLSNTFDVSGKLVFAVNPPASAFSKEAFNISVKIVLPDNSNPNPPITGQTITLSIIEPFGGNFTNGSPGNSRSGNTINNGGVSQVDFNSLDITDLGLYKFLASSSSELDPVISGSPLLIKGKIVVSAPSPLTPQATLPFTVTVTVKQNDGLTTVTSYNGPIYLSLPNANNPTNSFFYGLNAATASGGVATFNNMIIMLPTGIGQNYQLQGALPDGVSTGNNSDFTVTAPPACNNLVVNTTALTGDDGDTTCTTITLPGAVTRAAAQAVTNNGKKVPVILNRQPVAGPGAFSNTAQVEITIDDLTFLLNTIPSGVQIDGGCLNGGAVQGLKLKPGTATSLTLSGNDALRGIFISLGDTSNRMKLVANTAVIANGTGNILSCSKVGS